MPRLLRPLWLLLATAADRELARMVEYLKEENRVLRDRLPKRIAVTPRERQRLVTYGKPLGPKVKELVTIVSPRTFMRWLSDGSGVKAGQGIGRTPGRPKTLADVRTLVLRIAGKRPAKGLMACGVRGAAWVSGRGGSPARTEFGRAGRSGSAGSWDRTRVGLLG